MFLSFFDVFRGEAKLLFCRPYHSYLVKDTVDHGFPNNVPSLTFESNRFFVGGLFDEWTNFQVLEEKAPKNISKKKPRKKKKKKLSFATKKQKPQEKAQEQIRDLYITSSKSIAPKDNLSVSLENRTSIRYRRTKVCRNCGRRQSKEDVKTRHSRAAIHSFHSRSTSRLAGAAIRDAYPDRRARQSNVPPPACEQTPTHWIRSHTVKTSSHPHTFRLDTVKTPSRPRRRAVGTTPVVFVVSIHNTARNTFLEGVLLNTMYRLQHQGVNQAREFTSYHGGTLYRMLNVRSLSAMKSGSTKKRVLDVVLTRRFQVSLHWLQRSVSFSCVFSPSRCLPYSFREKSRSETLFFAGIGGKVCLTKSPSQTEKA